MMCSVLKIQTPPMAWLMAVLLVLSGCEKMVVDDDTTTTSQQDGRPVVVRVTDMEAGWGDATSRGLVPIGEVCSRLSFAVYQGGQRVKYANQKAGDTGFGSLTLQLGEGTYQLLIVGHSGNANPATTNPARVPFTNPGSSGGTGFTDTFYYYGDLTVTSGGTRVDVGMKRATAMMRLKTKDAKPANVRKFQFYYEGGSGTLDATTGFGCVNSKQSVFVETGDELTGQPLEFEMYTFPHQESGEVTFTVKAFDANETVVYTRVLEKVTMKRNCITQCTGNFFTADEPVVEPDTPGPGESQALVVMVDPEWGEVMEWEW